MTVRIDQFISVEKHTEHKKNSSIKALLSDQIDLVTVSVK